MIKYPIGYHPGSGSVYVICDICGRKVHRKDTVLVRDRYNFQNNMVVCFRDVDKVNQQSLPIRIRERLVSDPKTLRPPSPDVSVAVENDDRAPSAPLNLQARASALGTDVELVWTGPADTGSSPILGYVIARARPQFAHHFVIDSDSGSPATYYKDLTADYTLEYSYKIAAFNSFGTGPYSEIACYPTQRDNNDYGYILAETYVTILAENGEGIYYD